MLDNTLRVRKPHKRNTVQKRVIKLVLQNVARPITPQEILVEAKKTVPSIGMATVYRELRRLQDGNEVRQVDLPGEPPRFSVVTETKSTAHHFKCSHCQRVFPLEDVVPYSAIKLPAQFKHESHQLVVFGTCAEGCYT